LLSSIWFRFLRTFSFSFSIPLRSFMTSNISLKVRTCSSNNSTCRSINSLLVYIFFSLFKTENKLWPCENPLIMATPVHTAQINFELIIKLYLHFSLLKLFANWTLGWIFFAVLSCGVLAEFSQCFFGVFMPDAGSTRTDDEGLENVVLCRLITPCECSESSESKIVQQL